LFDLTEAHLFYEENSSSSFIILSMEFSTGISSVCFSYQVVL